MVWGWGVGQGAAWNPSGGPKRAVASGHRGVCSAISAVSRLSPQPLFPPHENARPTEWGCELRKGRKEMGSEMTASDRWRSRVDESRLTYYVRRGWHSGEEGGQLLSA